MYKVSVWTVLFFCCASAGAHPVQSPGQSLAPVQSSPHTQALAAPVPFFRPPDPGIPAVDPSATTLPSNIAPAPNQPTAPLPNSRTDFNFGGGALTPTDTTHHGNARFLLNTSTAFPSSDVIKVSLKPTFDPESGQLTPGNFLIKTAEDTSVDTHFGKIKIAGHSCVLLANSASALTVYDLHDSHSGSVVWQRGQGKLKLLPGWQLTITHDLQEPIGRLNPCSSITLRSLQSEVLPGGIKIFLGNFSIGSAISLVEPLRHDQIVLKTAAIQNFTTP